MNKLILTLTDQNRRDDLELIYQLKSHDLIQRWLDRLIHFLLSPNGKLEERFFGFQAKTNRVETMITQLNHCIEIINRDGVYKLEPVLNNRWDTQTHNRIHHYFEKLMGPQGDTNPYYLHGDMRIKHAINGINELSHDLEGQTHEQGIAAIHTLFKYRYIDNDETMHTIPFLEQDFEHFTLDFNWGDLVLKYCQVGKTWPEVFLDRDECIDRQNIRPHNCYDGSFDILFYAGWSKEDIARLHQWLIAQGEDPSNKKLGLGFLVAGQLETHTNVDELSQYQQIKSIAAIKDGHKYLRHILNAKPTYLHALKA